MATKRQTSLTSKTVKKLLKQFAFVTPYVHKQLSGLVVKERRKAEVG
jgi:hypothetical protein